VTACTPQDAERRWTSWYRWVTLAMLASAFLTIAAAGHARRPAPADQAALTRNEIAHLLASLTSPPHNTRHRIRWSRLATTPPAPRPRMPLPAAVHAAMKCGRELGAGCS
jgi:hypothetical protein